MRELGAADLIVHAGDFTSYAVLDELRAYGEVVGVYATIDHAALRDELPLETVVDVAGARIGLVHIPGPSAGRAERLAERFPGCAAVVYGHTHVPEVSRRGGVWILSPGSPTERRRSPTHTMIRLEIGAGDLRPELLVLR